MATRKQRTLNRAKRAVKTFTPALQAIKKIASPLVKTLPYTLKQKSPVFKEGRDMLKANALHFNANLLQTPQAKNYSPAPSPFPNLNVLKKPSSGLRGPSSPVPLSYLSSGSTITEPQSKPEINIESTEDTVDTIDTPIDTIKTTISPPVTSASTTSAQGQAPKGVSTVGGSPRSYVVGANQIEDPVYKNLMRELRATAQTDINEDDIKRRTIREYQAQLNAVNSVYNDLLARAELGGQQNLGTERAIQARSGLLGSDFGASRTQAVQKETRQEVGGIEAQRSMDLSNIYEGSRVSAQNEIKRLRDLKSSSVEGYLEALNTERDVMDKGLSQIAMDAVSQGFTVDTMGEDAINSLARDWKTSKEVVRNKLREAESATAVAPEYFNLSEGQSRYMIDPQTGEAVMVARSAKTYKPTTGGSTGDTRYGGVALSKTQQGKVDQLNSVMSSLDEYRALYDSLTTQGGHRLTGKSAGDLAGFYNALMFQIAQASGTGALQAPDRQIVESMVPNPTTIKGATKAKIRGGKTGALGSIDQARKVFENSKNAIIGTVEEAPQSSGITEDEYEELKSLGYSEEETQELI